MHAGHNSVYKSEISSGFDLKHCDEYIPENKNNCRCDWLLNQIVSVKMFVKSHFIVPIGLSEN